MTQELVPRESEIISALKDYPEVLVRIILEYSKCWLKKEIIRIQEFKYHPYESVIRLPNNLLASSFCGIIYIWDLGTGKCVNMWTSMRDRINNSYVSKTTMCQVDDDRIIVRIELICVHDIVYGFMLNFKTGECRKSPMRVDETTKKIGSGLNIFVTASYDGKVRAWDSKTHEPIYSTRIGSSHEIMQVLVPSVDRIIVCTSNNLTFINIKTKEMKNIKIDTIISKPILFGDNLAFIESGSHTDYYVTILDDTGVCVRKIKTDVLIHDIVGLKNNHMALISKNQIFVMDPDNQCVQTIDDNVHLVVAHDDGWIAMTNNTLCSYNLTRK